VLNNTFRIPSKEVLCEWRISAGLINADSSIIMEQEDNYITGDINFENEDT
jgi:hypothetical protein